MTRGSVRRIRPAAEVLEDRTLLTVVTWDGGANTLNWHDAANWSNDVLPGSGDDVVIDFGANDFTVSIGAGDSFSINSLTTRADVNSAGTLSFANGGLGLGAGSLFENAGTVELWSDAGMSGAGEFHNSGSLVKRDGNTARRLTYGSLINVGAFTNTGLVDIRVGTVGLVRLTNDGTISGADGTTVWLLDGAESIGDIDADHVRFHTSGPAEFLISGSFGANLVEVVTRHSIVRLSGEVSSLGDVSVRGTLDLTGATIVGAGATLTSLALATDGQSGVPPFLGNITTGDDFVVTGQFVSSGGLLQGVGGRGSLRTNGGALIHGIDLGGGFDLLNPVGAAIAQYGNIGLGTGSVLENAGTLEFWSDAGIFGGAGSEFLNSGTLAKRDGNPARRLTYGSLIDVGTFTNTGLIDVRVGTVGLGNVSNSGRIIGADGTGVWLLGGVQTTGSSVIDADDIRFHTGHAVDFSIAGSFEANLVEVVNRDSTVRLSGIVSGLGDVTVLGTLDLSHARLIGAATTWRSLRLATDGRSGVPPFFGTVITGDDLAVAGQFVSSGGLLQGVGGQGRLRTNGGALIYGVNLGGGIDLLNPFGATIAQYGNIDLGDGSVFENAGTLEIWSDASLLGTSASVILNTGTFSKRGGSTARDLFYGSVIGPNFTNSGVIDLRVGTLALGNPFGANTNSGRISGEIGTTLWLLEGFNSSGVIDADHVRFHVANASITGSFKANRTELFNSSSTVRISGTILGLGDVVVGNGGSGGFYGGGTLDLTGATFAAGATRLASLALNDTFGYVDDSFLVADANLTVTGLFKWQGTLRGAGSLRADGGTLISGGGTSALAGGFDFFNPSEVLTTWESGGIGLGYGSVYENAGTMELWSDASINGGNHGDGLFHNTGTFAKRGGSTAPNLFYGSVLGANHTINDGTIRVDVGTLGLGYLENNGNIVARAAAGQPRTTLWLFNDLDIHGSVDADHVRFHGADARISGSFLADRTALQDQSSTVRISGTVLGLGNVVIGVNFADGFSGGGTLDLTGATFVGAATTLESLTIAAIHPAVTARLITDDDLAVTGSFNWNLGTLQGVGGLGSLTVLSDMTLNGTYFVRGFNLINAGHAIWSGGSVDLDGASRFTNLDSFDDRIDGEFGGPGCPVFDNRGLFVKSGGSGATFLQMQLHNSGTVLIQQGVLNISCGYVQVIASGGGSAGTISGSYTGRTSVRNDGEYTPDPTTPPVTNYTQTATGVLVERIGGTTAGTGYGQIVVTGNVNLDGALRVEAFGGFVPQSGNVFRIIDNRGENPVNGIFAGFAEGALVTAVGGELFRVSYTGGDGNDVTLSYVPPPDPLVVTMTGDVVANDGYTSLREAILYANSHAGLDTIEFAIGAGDPGYDGARGVWTIRPLTQLPEITEAVVIDGYTQAGARVNTLAQGSNAALKIELRGDALTYSGDVSDNANGLILHGTVGSTIRGLAIGDFAGSGIVVAQGGDNRIEGNFIGTDAAGTVGHGNGRALFNPGAPENPNSFVAGIALYSSDNVIGGTTAATRNVISHNLSGVAVRFVGNPELEGHRNRIQGNLIGTDASGNNALGNRAFGVWVNFRRDNLVGGTEAGAGNVISGNGAYGVLISGSDHAVQGNRIGTNAAGDRVVSNAINGVVVINATDALIGGTAAGAGNVIAGGVRPGSDLAGYGVTFVNSTGAVQGNFIGTDVTGTRVVDADGKAFGFHGGVSVQYTAALIGGAEAGARNVISGNDIGVDVRAAGTEILGNYIGTDVTGTAALGNGTGVYLADSASEVVVGRAAAGNLISGNRGHGVIFNGASTSRGRVQGNRIGTNAAGTAALGNGPGVAIEGASEVLVGTDGDGTDDAAEGNLISGNGGDGLSISGNRNVIRGNLIGTDVAGNADLGNGRFGLWVRDGDDNLIGGTAPGSGNLVSGNDSQGLLVGGRRSVVQGNRVGTNAAGDAPLSNAGIGINEFGEDSLIGGTAPGAGNLVYDALYGLAVGGARTRVQGNLIGTDATGTFDLDGSPSGGAGIIVRGSDTRIGGTDPAARNVISGNNIGIFFGGPGLVVQGNYIGTDVTGTRSVGNVTGIILAGDFDKLIGGSAPGAGNVISGNAYRGIEVYDSGTRIQGNRIGINATGAALGNGESGIIVRGPANTVGTDGDGVNDAAEGNVIAHNGLSGVWVYGGQGPASGNTIRGNAIRDNGSLGITLRDAFIFDALPNDAGDADEGANGWQNYPVIASAGYGPATRVAGSLNSTPNATFTLDFYASTAADPSGHGEGERWLGSVIVTTDAGGNATFDVTFAVSTAAGEFLTATATAPDGSTSEFSAAFAVVNPTNRPPVAQDGTANTNEDVAIEIDLRTLASDPDNDVLAFSVFGAANGTVVLLADGHTARFTPAANYYGPASFTYTATDSAGTSDSGTVAITVASVNDPPVAGDATATTNEDTAVNVDLRPLASDVDGDALTFSVGPAVNGTVVLLADGHTARFTPAANYHGPASFVYTATDPSGASDGGTVAVAVAAVNDPPVAANAAMSVTEDGSVSGHVTASDVDGDTLTFALVSGPAHGSLVFNPNGTFTYMPGAGCGAVTADAFTFRAFDGAAYSNVATVTITIQPAVGTGQVTVGAGGVVRIGGTSGNDVILVTQTSGNLKVTINGVVVTNALPAIAVASVSEVRVWGREGNDRIDVVDLTIDTRLDGGAGDDVITGGAGDDLIFGGEGDDTITGAAGNDFLIGGSGADRIVGSAGDDILVADEVNCALVGQALRDVLDWWAAGAQPDDEDPEELADEESVDLAFDKLTGSSGDDWFLLGAGDEITEKLKGGDRVSVV